MALSMDIRLKVIKAIERGETTPSIAARFEIGERTVYDFKARHIAGQLAPDKPGPQNSTKLTEADHRMLATTVAIEPGITLVTLATKMSVPVALSTISRALKKQGLTLKKSR